MEVKRKRKFETRFDFILVVSKCQVESWKIISRCPRASNTVPRNEQKFPLTPLPDITTHLHVLMFPSNGYCSVTTAAVHIFGKPQTRHDNQYRLWFPIMSKRDGSREPVQYFIRPFRSNTRKPKCTCTGTCAAAGQPEIELFSPAEPVTIIVMNNTMILLLLLLFLYRYIYIYVYMLL